MIYCFNFYSIRLPFPDNFKVTVDVLSSTISCNNGSPVYALLLQQTSYANEDGSYPLAARVRLLVVSAEIVVEST